MAHIGAKWKGKWLVLWRIIGRDMARLEADVGLNSGGERLLLTDFKVSLQCMQGVTERNSLNWLFGVSGMLFGLSSCIWGGSDSISGELISMHSSV